jgi:hypothetical protein
MIRDPSDGTVKEKPVLETETSGLADVTGQIGLSGAAGKISGVAEGIPRNRVNSHQRGTTWRDHDVRANPTTRRLRSTTASHMTC